MEWHSGAYYLSDDRARMDLGRIQSMLAGTYWAASRPLEAIRLTIERSVCFGLFHDGVQIGFARLVTDGVSFAWLCDVVIHPAHRGIGIGKWMVGCIFEHPLARTRLQMLATRDAQGLYEQFGFESIHPSFMMRGDASHLR